MQNLIRKLCLSVWGSVAEIWDKARWDEKNAEVELNIEEIASDMEASGFSI